MTANTNKEDRSPQDLEHGPPEHTKYIDWDGPEDPRHPMNWNIWRRVWPVTMMAMLNLATTTSSSMFGSGQTQVAQEFHVSSEITILGTTLFVLGYVFGPPFFGPLSEKFGRKNPMVIGSALSGIFTLIPALSNNIGAILFGRFLAGFFGVAPIAIFAGVNVDVWKPHQRALGISTSLMTVLIGPVLGPVIGDFVVQSHLGWRWTQWLSIIFTLSMVLVELLLVPETYPPLVLARIAQKARKKTGDELIRSEFEDEGIDIHIIVHIYLIRPWKLFFTEPILVLINLYQSFVYGLLYLFFQAYPIAFREVRGWQLGISGLPLLGIAIGFVLGHTILTAYNLTRAQTLYKKDNNTIVPERRLPMLAVAGAMLPMSLFWFAWTANPDVPWPAQVCSGILFGIAAIIIFSQCFTYLTDVYAKIANSALTSNGVCRSLCGAGFPLFASAMYHNLGVPWATSVLGFISIALVPVPIVFYYYGARIRAASPNIEH